jgi:glycerophosphoryl diester phosphodiesterase
MVRIPMAIGSGHLGGWMTGKPLRIGHRGAAGHAPENTLRAFEAGIALGCDYLEFDVQRTADGHLVVMHDKRVDRTTDGTGVLSEMTLAELKALDAGSGARVPLLDEVLRTATGRCGLMIEIITPGLAGELFAAVESFGFTGPLIYASFLHQEMLEIRRLDAAVPTLCLLEGVPVGGAHFAQDACATHAGLALDSATSSFVADLQAAQVSVFVYTADDPRDIARLKDWGVNGIVSNCPERILG